LPNIIVDGTENYEYAVTILLDFNLFEVCNSI